MIKRLSNYFILPENRTEITRYFLYLLIAGCFLFLLMTTWCRWGEIVIDTFRDAVTAQKLVEGKLLYTDIFYLFGILPPYTLALVNLVFGISLYCFVGMGIALTAVCIVLIYRIARVFLGRFLSTLCALNFLYLHAFNMMNKLGVSNFILPYSLATEMVIVFILGALYSFIKFVHTEKQVYLNAMMLCLTASFLSRPEMTLPPLCALAAAGFFSPLRKRLLMPLALSAILSAGIYAVYFTVFHNFKDFLSIVPRMIFYEGSGRNPFARVNLGMYEMECINQYSKLYYRLPENIHRMFFNFLLQAGTILGLYFLSDFLRFIESKLSSKNLVKNIVMPVVACAVFFTVWHVLSGEAVAQWPFQYRSVPLFLILGLATVLIGYPRSDKHKLSLIALIGVSLALLIRIFFSISTYHYGAFLLVPGSIACFVVYSQILPFLIQRYTGIKANPVYFKVLIAIFIFSMGFLFIKGSMKNYQKKNFEIETSRARMLYFGGSAGSHYQTTIKYLKEYTPKDAQVVVFPEGLGINYFSERDCPMRYDSYLPNILNIMGEDAILGELKSRRIDYAVIINRYTTEYNVSFFGLDYGEKIWKWIFDNFEPVYQTGGIRIRDAFDFGAVIMKRKQKSDSDIRKTSPIWVIS